MSFINTSNSITALVRQFTGRSIPESVLESEFRLDVAVDPIGCAKKMDAYFGSLEDRRRDKTRMDSTARYDAAMTFTTHALAATLERKRKVSKEKYLMVPGRTGDRAPLLPVSAKTQLGQTELVWETDAISGEARWIGPNGTRELTRGSQANDQNSQKVAMYGARYGYDLFDQWRAGLISQNIQQDQRDSAVDAMDQHAERAWTFGSEARKQPGFFNHGCAYKFGLPVAFGDGISVDNAIINIQIMNKIWNEGNPNRAPSGVVLPASHIESLDRIFIDALHTTLIEHLERKYPWFKNRIQDDRMLTASSTGGPMWQMYSADSDDLFIESLPAQLYGPFEIDFETDFILLAQTACVVCREPTLIMRFEQ